MTSTRAEIVTRRTYNRPTNDEGTVFETWKETVGRVVEHQAWLWSRAKGQKNLTAIENLELEALGQLMIERKASVSGRTLWLGGTNISRTREASQFNCSFVQVETVHDVVDVLWLLMQGCGVGFKATPGTLNGFVKPLKIEVVRSKRHELSESKAKGKETNDESIKDGVWTIKVGDSAEAWSKALGKLIAGKHNAHTLVLDFSEIRPSGKRLKGYGWISSGDDAIAIAFPAIAGIMNKRAGRLLNKIDILDLVNWCGSILSSRRSAQIALHDFDSFMWEEFATAKKDFWIENPQRGQSNNSLVFNKKPSKAELYYVFKLMQEAGGSEPGFINGETAKKRAEWWKGVNPCAEIALGNKNFCNLVELDLQKFNGKFEALLTAIQLIARANYRQTCVNLDDGILQRTWHELNEFLRLCGVGLTGIVSWEYVMDDDKLTQLKEAAYAGAHSMADELGLPRAQAVTTVKPSGTLSKIMDTTEGVHKPLGKYIFNNINFSIHDPLTAILRQAGYKVFPNPSDPEATLVCFPVKYDQVKFDVVDGKEVNSETALDQLARYKWVMNNYVDKHNCSVTISYDVEEVDEIVNWIIENWDIYVGVSFIYRNDPTKTAKDLGYLYLPQEVVTKEEYETYANTLKPVAIDLGNTLEELLEEECLTGACPIR